MVMLRNVLLLLGVLLVIACQADDTALQPPPDAGMDAASPADRDASEPGASDAAVDAAAATDGALDASAEADASEPECPAGTTRQYRQAWTNNSPCTEDDMECVTIAEEVTCARYVYSAASCAEVGGTVIGDLSDECPGDTSILGTIEKPDGTFSMCCRELRSCAGQIVQSAGVAPHYIKWFWDGSGCSHYFDGGCVGPDCNHVFDSQEACYEAYVECNRIVRRCGAGGTCFANEYCAYAPSQYCNEIPEYGASASCQLRPDSCDDVSDPVCGCDHKTYANACEAARANQGIFNLGTCESFEEHCMAPCGSEHDEAIVAECAAITGRLACLAHQLDADEDAGADDAGAATKCRWKNDTYSACPAP